MTRTNRSLPALAAVLAILALLAVSIVGQAAPALADDHGVPDNGQQAAGPYDRDADGCSRAHAGFGMPNIPDPGCDDPATAEQESGHDADDSDPEVALADAGDSRSGLLASLLSLLSGDSEA